MGGDCLHDTRTSGALDWKGLELEDCSVTLLEDGLWSLHIIHLHKLKPLRGAMASELMLGHHSSTLEYTAAWQLPPVQIASCLLSASPFQGLCQLEYWPLIPDRHLMQLAQRAPRTLTRNADSTAKLVGILTARCGVPEESIGKVLTRCVLPCFLSR